MVDCDHVVAILVLDGGTSEGSSVTTYGENVSYSDRGATFKAESFSYGSSPTIRTFCEDPTPNVGEIMGVKLTDRFGFSAIESGSYPNAPERNYSYPRGEVTSVESEFLILNTRSGPDYWLPGVNPPSEVTPLATTKPGIVDRDFRVWIGSKKAIDQWVGLNSLKIDETVEFDNFAGGKTVNTTYQYQGWRVACSFPYEALLAYPFCGGVVRGREDEGPQFINLCENDLGFCSDVKCCDCCDIAQRVLAIFGEPVP